MMSDKQLNGKDPELNHLFWKDEILQVMYWMYGEDLGEEVSMARLVTLLNSSVESLEWHMEQLQVDNYLISQEMNGEIAYKLTDFGRKEAGQRFAGAFEGLQKAGHGECSADCDCQWEGHDSCQHHLHKH